MTNSLKLWKASANFFNFHLIFSKLHFQIIHRKRERELLQVSKKRKRRKIKEKREKRIYETFDIHSPCPRRRKRSWISSFSASSKRTKMTWADTSREKFHITLSSPVYRPLRISFPFFSFYCRRCTLFFFFFFLPFVSTQHANNFAINSCFARNMHPFQTWIFTPTF